MQLLENLFFVKFLSFLFSFCQLELLSPEPAVSFFLPTENSRITAPSFRCIRIAIPLTSLRRIDICGAFSCEGLSSMANVLTGHIIWLTYSVQQIERSLHDFVQTGTTLTTQILYIFFFFGLASHTSLHYLPLKPQRVKLKKNVSAKLAHI